MGPGKGLEKDMFGLGIFGVMIVYLAVLIIILLIAFLLRKELFLKNKNVVSKSESAEKIKSDSKDCRTPKKRSESYPQYNGLLEPISGKMECSDKDDVTVDLTTGKIEVTSGIYQGAVIELGYGESILIGRDERICGLVILEKEISRKHCEISYDAYSKCYSVTDYSTNGVYLADKSELAKGTCVKLEPGNILQLGKTQNVLLLK